MENSNLIIILILALISLLFIMARANSIKVPVQKKEKIFNKLEDLKTQTESDDTYARRDAVIKLDNLLTKSLQIRYKNEKSCSDNLKLAKGLFRKDTYQRIWDVHKLRNKIVHKDEDVSYDSAVQAYKVYKMAVEKLLK